MVGKKLDVRPPSNPDRSRAQLLVLGRSWCLYAAQERAACMILQVLAQAKQVSLSIHADKDSVQLATVSVCSTGCLLPSHTNISVVMVGGSPVFPEYARPQLLALSQVFWSTAVQFHASPFCHVTR